MIRGPLLRPCAVALVGFALLLSSGAFVRADLIQGFPTNLADNASPAAIQGYFQGAVDQFHPGGTVTVTGAGYSTSYNGDGHVVGGPTGPGGSIQSVTLATQYGGFLFDAQSHQPITITFSFPITSLSFAFEIFPDATVPNGSRVNPALYPDFSFYADGQLLLHQLAQMPNAPSPATGPNGTELAPQYLGSASFVFPGGGVTQLQFLDWPVRIGVSNFQFGNGPTVPGGGVGPPTVPLAQVPEPATIVGFGLGLVALVVAGRQHRRGRHRALHIGNVG